MGGGRVPFIRRSSTGPSAATANVNLFTQIAGAPLPYKSGFAALPAGNTVAVTLVQNDELASPFWTTEDAVLDDVTIQVTTLGASSTIRLGVRSDAGFDYPYPGTLLLDKGTIDSSTTGLKTWSDIDITIPAFTVFWLTFTEQGGTPPQVTGTNGSHFPQLIDAGASLAQRGYKQAGVSGALSTFSTTIVATASIPRPAVKWA